MSEEQKNKDNKEEKEKTKNKKDGVEKKAAKVTNKTGKKDKSENKISGLEELPEDIKKKLEKKKAERKKRSKKNRKKKKTQRYVISGKAYIKATYNNTIVTLTDLEGNVISWASAGIAGFKGPKKATPYAAQIITRIAVERARELGLAEVSVFVKGVGTGRDSAIRALNANGLNVVSIKDITPNPHNGCRPRKPRRV